MKTKSKIKAVLFGVAISGSLFAPCVSAQGSHNLSNFKGNHQGSVVHTDPEGNVKKGRARAKFIVARSGRSGSIAYQAVFPDGQGGSDAFPTGVTLRANKRADVTDLLVGIAGENNAKPGRGGWSQRQRKLTFVANNGEGISLRATATVRDVGKRRKVALKLVSTDPGGSYVFTNTLNSRLP